MSRKANTHSAFRVRFLGVELSDSFQICGVPQSGLWVSPTQLSLAATSGRPARLLGRAQCPIRRSVAVFASVSVSGDGALSLSPRALRFSSLSKPSMRLCAALTGSGGQKETVKPAYLLGIPLWGQAPHHLVVRIKYVVYI